MYMYAVTLYAEWKRYNQTGNSLTTVVFVLPLADDRLIQATALKACHQFFPQEEGYTNHKVNCMLVPSRLKRLLPDGTGGYCTVLLEEAEGVSYGS